MTRLSSARVAALLAEYDVALGRSALSGPTRRVYRSRVAGFLDWLVAEERSVDAVSQAEGRNEAVRDYRRWLRRHRQATTVNAALTALDHFYTHLKLGPAPTPREELAGGARRVLDADEQRAFLQAVERHLSTRDRAIAHSLFYAGLRVAELVNLDLPDVLLTPERGRLIVPGREIPLHPHPGPSLQEWLGERGRAGAGQQAVFLNRRGGRLTSRSVDQVIRQAGATAGLEDSITPLVLRRTFAQRLLQDGTAIEQVARLMGHARLDTTRRYAT